jgi:hypothetical protein
MERRAQRASNGRGKAGEDAAFVFDLNENLFPHLEGAAPQNFRLAADKRERLITISDDMIQKPFDGMSELPAAPVPKSRWHHIGSLILRTHPSSRRS